MQMCEVAEDYLKTRQLRLYSDRQAIWTQLEQFTRLAHGSLDPRATAYTLANEGRRLIDCDRISVAIRKGGIAKSKPSAGKKLSISDPTPSRCWRTGHRRRQSGRTALVHSAIRAICRRKWKNQSRPMSTNRTRKRWSFCHCRSRKITRKPITQPKPKPEFVGALDHRTNQYRRHSRRHATPHRRGGRARLHGITNAIEHDSLFLMPVWRTIGKSKWIVSARTLPKTIAIAIVCWPRCFRCS